MRCDLFDKTWVAIDCESTGLDSRARLTEVAGVTCTPDGVADHVFASLVNPELPIPIEVVRLTGITNAMAATAPSLENVLRRFLDWLPSTVCVAHNAEFDLKLLAREARRVGIEWPVLYFVDTLPIARFLGETRNERLRTLVEHHHWPILQTPHRALSDSWAVVCFMRYALTHRRFSEYQSLLTPKPFPV